MNKVLIVDPSSYSLPYDYFYISELQKFFLVDFYYSATASNYEYIQKLKKLDNVNLFEYKISPSCTNKYRGALSYVAMLKDIYVNRAKYHKIHFIWSVAFTLEFFLLFLIKDKFIFTFHNDVPHSHPQKTYWPYRVIAKLASKMVFVSKYTMNSFIKNYRQYKNCHLIQHGIMPIGFPFINNEEKLLKKLIFWGRVEEYKGLDTFVDFSFDIPIEIHGKWSKNLMCLKNTLSKKSNIEINDAYLPGAELSKILNNNSVFILPYKDATQSGVLYTLLSYGKVFISSNVGENRDFLVKHGFEKLIFDRKDKESIIAAMNYAFENYFEIKRKLLEIKAKYKWDVIMDEQTMRSFYE